VDASPVKLAVIGVMLLIGVITLAAAFDDGIPQANTTVEVANPESPAADDGSSTTTDGGKDNANQTSEGVQIGVYNGTTTEGVAGEQARLLEREGYVIAELGNTVSPIKKSVIYFSKPNDQAAAEYLADNQYPGTAVQAKPEDLQVVVEGNETSPTRSAAVLVMIGADNAG
jgi:hypothetical protein